MDVSAIIVTRGDVDLAPILASLPDEWEKIVWDNGAGAVTAFRPIVEDGAEWRMVDGGETTMLLPDLAVYGRYAAIEYASHDLIYCQDDDCVLKNPVNVVAAYEPDVVTYNMPYAFRDGGVDSEMVGFGACFHRGLPGKAFHKYHQSYEGDLYNAPLFHRTCDVVFTTLTTAVMIHEPLELLECSYADNRMWRQPGHNTERRLTREICELLA